jgi:hypothetical protein
LTIRGFEGNNILTFQSQCTLLCGKAKNKNSLLIVMKTKLSFNILAAIIISCLVSGYVSAQVVLQKVAITGTIITQNPNTIDIHGLTTTPPATKVTRTTADFLALLAHEEYVLGNLPSNGWPAGSALFFNGTGFEVDKGTTFHMDVSNVLGWSLAGTNDLTSGAYNDKNGPENPPYSRVENYVATISCDAKDTGGAVQFHATGVATATTTATAPSKAGSFTISSALHFSNGTGEGSTDNGPIIVTDLTISASGSAKED